MNSRLSILVAIILLVCGIPLITDAQLFDGKREGLLIGGGVGFAAAATGNDDSGGSFSRTGFVTSGRIGYGLSDELTIYFSSSVPNIVPSLGVMYFADPNSEYYLQGLFGYASGSSYSLFSIAGGLGYELRDRITLEGMFGYHRHTDTYYSPYQASLLWGPYDSSEPTHTNIITMAVTFNFYFY